MEGKAAREAASECGQRASFNGATGARKWKKAAKEGADLPEPPDAEIRCRFQRKTKTLEATTVKIAIFRRRFSSLTCPLRS